MDVMFLSFISGMGTMLLVEFVAVLIFAWRKMK